MQLGMDASHVAADVQILVDAILAGGEGLSDESQPYSHKISFGLLFTMTEDTLEALMGTMRAAKKQKIVDFKKQMLLHPGDDREEVYLIRK